MRFRRARAPRRAGGTHSVRCKRALHEREAALLAAQGRASTFQPWPSLGQVACACSALARHCARSLLGRGPARALATCARLAALVGVGPCPMAAHCASGMALSLGARPCSDMPAAASKRAAYLRMCARKQTDPARALSLSGGGAARAIARCARPASLVGVVHTLWKPTVPAGRPSPSVHSRAPTCQPRPPNEQSTCACAQEKKTTLRARALYREEAQHARLRRARAPPRSLESVYTL